MNQARVDAVGESIASIGYEGITAFDRTEPEYDAIIKLYDRYEDETYVKLLATIATTQDYMLNGDAQRFWKEFEDVSLNADGLSSIRDVKIILNAFMERSVNARLKDQKKSRLVKIFESEFAEWFVDNHTTAEPLEVWTELADSLNSDMDAKTVVLAMKVYDIAHLIKYDEYLEFPEEIPIPCDLQVVRVSKSSGVIDSENHGQVLSTWAEVMATVSENLGRHVSLLRIDSIVWQAGQIIGKHEPNKNSARENLLDHFEEVGLKTDSASRLATELTAGMD